MKDEEIVPARCNCGHVWMAHSAGRGKCFECNCKKYAASRIQRDPVEQSMKGAE